MSDPSLFDDDEATDKLARNTDPDTSKRAAKSLNLTVKPGDIVLLDWILNDADDRMATHDEAAVWLVSRGYYRRHEAARRRVRVLRENHGFLDYAYVRDAHGRVIFQADGSPIPLERENESGRDAQLLTVTGQGRMEIARRAAESGL